ncbi:MAG TPA: SURF1 family protein [Acidimicrobiia bacterium]|nr:SURF1 family protein [Acidimicrobiia bacterium]
MNPILRPRWLLGHLLAAGVVVGFIALGLWQLDRHAEKSDLRAAVAAGQELSPTDLADAAEGSFRRVVVVGEYDDRLQALVLRSRGGVSGYHVLTPLTVEGGPAVLVDRGWIPLDLGPPAPPAGLVKVDGVLWPAQEGSSVPDALPEVVRRIDPEIQAAFAGYPLRSDYLILSGPSDGLPIPAEPPGIGLGPHLGYAGQWFLFAAIVLIGYPLLLRRTLLRSGDNGP